MRDVGDVTVPVKDVERVDDHGGGGRGGPLDDDNDGSHRVRVEVEGREDRERTGRDGNPDDGNDHDDGAIRRAREVDRDGVDGRRRVPSNRSEVAKGDGRGGR